MEYFTTPSLGDFMGENTVKYWDSTVGCTEKTGGIKRTNIDM